MKRNVLFISLIMFLFVGIISCEKEESEEDTTTDSTSSDSNTDQSTTKNVDFEDLSLSAESSWNGSDGSGGFVSGEVTFDTYYTTSPDTFWHGFAYSNTTDDTTAGISNWASAYAASGVSGSDNYGVFYYDAFGDSAMYISFNAEVTMKSVFVTNNTYAALVMKDGDATFG